MCIFGYIRSGSAKTADDPNSIESQLNLITKYAEKKKFGLVTWHYERGYSGKITLSEREKGEKLLEEIKKGDKLIVSSFDRLFGNAADAFETLNLFQEKGIELHLVNLNRSFEKKDFEIIGEVLGAVATEKRPDVGKKIKAAKERLREQGKHQGGKVPFGYRIEGDGKLVKDPLQQECIKIMKKKREEGLSYRAISELLMNEKKVKLSYNGVRKVLTEDRKV